MDKETHMIRSLQTDRIIHIYVGELLPGTKPFRVQQVLLEQLSDYFSGALRDKAFCEGEEGRLHFPEDDLDVWEVLLHWLFRRSLPQWVDVDSETKESLLIRCWVLADKYQVHDFQNEAMMDIMMHQSQHPACIRNLMHGVKVTAAGSKLRRIMAEELVWQVYIKKDIQFTELDQLDGPSFIGDFLTAKVHFDQNNNVFAGPAKFGAAMLTTPGEGPPGVWKEYMVGGWLPRRAWRWHDAMKYWVF
ncbi:hypothetical protein LTR56_018697 [Elasticomyces elasticus]|nr:hypothetical protein LTR56_018697 [Elasticomyces elasticus]KAK3634270.1 hypothetical protein LTR22_019716 [Elasticomyces elasticus]KAK4915286.1 hypothetical protein LTR49_016555 [Elasticomyces elasticus]KAK5754659.1 hypothetical protein LTS12_015264 [Elasticomyces elasticus]